MSVRQKDKAMEFELTINGEPIMKTTAGVKKDGAIIFYDSKQIVTLKLDEKKRVITVCLSSL